MKRVKLMADDDVTGPPQKTSATPIVDVVSPVSSSPDTSSRPTIVTRKPIVDDPMVTKRPPSPVVLPAKKPLVLSESDRAAVVGRDTSVPTTQEDDQTSPRLHNPQTTTSIQDGPQPELLEEFGEAVLQAVPDESLIGKDGAVHDDAQATPTIQLHAPQVITPTMQGASHGPVVSDHSSNKTITILLFVVLIVVLLVIGLNFAADAGLVDIGIEPLSDLL